MRWFMRLAYRGEGFHGWQVQPGQTTVQGRIEESLSTLTRTAVSVVGAGRTDTGVNARVMIAHVDMPDDADPTSPRFLHALNSLLGKNIAVYSFEPVAPDAHARFDATERTYRYFVHTVKDPFCGNLSWQAPPAFDFDAMNLAAKLICGKRDFTSFSKLHTDVKTNICDVRLAVWTEFEPGKWYFEIRADRFLRNMVRAVVGTLADVGRGKTAPETITEIIDRKDRCAAGTSMPAEPLFLWDIKYDR